MTSLSAREARLAYALLYTRNQQIEAAMKRLRTYNDQVKGDQNTAMLGEAPVGTVAMTNPQAKAKVTDPEQFAKHVQATREDEVEMKPVVNAAYQKALLDHMDKQKALIDWDGTEVPGVDFVAATPAQKVYLAEGAGDLLDVLEPGDLPEVPGIDLNRLLGVPMPAKDGETT